MTGRIKKNQIQAQLQALPAPPSGDTVCPLCDRHIPARQQDAHHLVPKSHGGVHTVVLHRICHRQIHALFTETELARQYPTVSALKAQNEMARFVRWVQTKPDGFFEKSRKSRRLKG